MNPLPQEDQFRILVEFLEGLMPSTPNRSGLPGPEPPAD